MRWAGGMSMVLWLFCQRGGGQHEVSIQEGLKMPLQAL